MQAEGIQNNADYEAFLRQYILFDPLDTAKTMLPETLRMVISRNDTSVPTPNQLTLHEAFGRPQASYTNSSHVSTVISTLWGASDRAAIARFFKQRFQLENPRPGVFEFFQHLYLAAAQ
jgi:hypothetical protein